MAWQTLDVGRGKPAYRVWCGVCGHDWSERIAAIGERVASGAGRAHPVSAFCECGSAIRVMPFGGTLQLDAPLRFEHEQTEDGTLGPGLGVARSAGS